MIFILTPSHRSTHSEYCIVIVIVIVLVTGIAGKFILFLWDPFWSIATSSVITTICQAARYDQLQFFTLGLISTSTFRICKRNFSARMKNVCSIRSLHWRYEKWSYKYCSIAHCSTRLNLNIEGGWCMTWDKQQPLARTVTGLWWCLVSEYEY